MARPSVFISSTFYDLRSVRTDLERFVKELGYDPILHERGHIAYEKDKPLEDACNREIQSSDILVCIIGGTYGTESKDGVHSITQSELSTAIKLGKQIYVFVEKNVIAEYRIYQRNKEQKEIKYAHVNDIRIFQFLDEIYALKVGNPIKDFETSQDIMFYLKEQWAGLFQRFLESYPKENEARLAGDLESNVKTLQGLVQRFFENMENKDQTIKEILISNHPIFRTLKNLLKVSYRVYFTNIKEFEEWVSAARSYISAEDPFGDGEWLEYKNEKTSKLLKIKRSVFDEEGNLKAITPEKWVSDWVKLEAIEQQPADIPF